MVSRERKTRSQMQELELSLDMEQARQIEITKYVSRGYISPVLSVLLFYYLVFSIVDPDYCLFYQINRK